VPCTSDRPCRALRWTVGSLDREVIEH
jgi:hypothetical protein